MSDLVAKREKEFLTLRLLALTAENEILIRNSSGSSDVYKQFHESQLRYQSSSLDYTQLQMQNAELRARCIEAENTCAELKARLHTVNEKYRLVTSQNNDYRKQIHEYESKQGFIFKLKRLIKRILRKLRIKDTNK